MLISLRPVWRGALRAAALCLLGAAPFGAGAADQPGSESADFVAAAFAGSAPAVRVLWLTPEVKTEVIRILGHEPAQLRQKYWSDGSRSVWILDEIGKEDAITAGFVVRDGRIEQARILVYRESRGGEIRYPSFLAQFQGAGLTDGLHLNRQIDGISGATLSVNAMLRMSREALYFARVAGGK